MGKALCNVEEGAFNYALQSMCVVAGRLNARQGLDREMMRVLEARRSGCTVWLRI